MTISQRFSLAISASMVMFFCAAAVGVASVWKSDVHDRFFAILVAVAIPGATSIIFVFVAVMVRDLIFRVGMRFPTNFTLPVVYGSLLPVTAALWSTPKHGIIQIHPQLAYARIWTSLGTILLAVVISILVLSLGLLLPTDEAEAAR